MKAINRRAFLNTLPLITGLSAVTSLTNCGKRPSAFDRSSFHNHPLEGIAREKGTPYEGSDYIKQFTEESIKPLLVGKNPFDLELFTSRGTNRHERAPWAGVDCALWDIVGKVKNRPVYELLATHNSPTTRIPIYASSRVEHECAKFQNNSLARSERRPTGQGIVLECELVEGSINS